MKEDPKKLSEEHWNYIEDVLENAWQNIRDVSELDWNSALCMIEYHYKTAFIHGFKHGQEAVCKE